MTTKEIEDYINTYRLYPDEYMGRRDERILVLLNSGYRYDVKSKMVTRLEGIINDDGDFVIDKTYTFPLGRPEDKVEIGQLEQKPMIRTYNNTMLALGHPEKTIGLDVSGPTENWNVRDTVAEVEYLRSTYYDPEHENSQLRHTDEREFIRRTQRLRNYIRRYKPYIDGVKTTAVHNSKYD